MRDGAPTLDRALRSIVASRGVELDLVCVNDGSTDATPHLLERWAERDPRLHVLHTPARGLVHALNTGLECARYERVARMDADDEMHPERLAVQAAFLDRNPAALVGCQVASRLVLGGIVTLRSLIWTLNYPRDARGRLHDTGVCGLGVGDRGLHGDGPADEALDDVGSHGA